MTRRTFYYMLSLLTITMAWAGVNVARADGETTLPKTFSTSDNANTVTISVDADSKTLTVSGKGDLTKIGIFYTFASTLADNTIFLKGSNDSYTSVSKETAYNSENTYATRAAQYTAIENFKDNYTEVSTHYYFTEAGAAKYYTRQQTGWGETPTYNYTAVKVGDEANKTEWVTDATKSAYFTKDADDTESYTRVDDLSTITSSETDVEKKEITRLKNISEVFCSTDNTNYSQVYTGNEYNESATYYTRSWEYKECTFDNLLSNSYLTKGSSLIKTLWANNTYETVKFVNEGSDALLVDNDIVKAILYYQVVSEWNSYFNVNTTITTLDLGAATCKNFTTTTFENTLQAGNGALKLANVTLPQSEDKTVPSQVVESIRQNNGAAIVKNITVPDGYTKIGDEAFINVDKAESINLPNGIVTIGKKAFYGTGIATWVLPTSLTTIEDDAFNSCKTLAHVTFPASLKTIGKGAFAQCEKLDSINLNDGLEIIGNSAFYLSSKNDNVKVLSIPSSVKYIGPAAFNFRWYADVYYYGEKAPISPYGISYINQDVTSAAFGSQLLCGNNGFQPMAIEGSTAGDISTGYANRENYINGGTYIAVLHFRSDVEDTNAETFTDITRKYERWLTEKKNSDGTSTGTYYWYSQDHKTVGSETEAPTFGGFGPGQAKDITPGFEDTDLGSQLIWPSQMQFIRSYAVNSNGYKWDGVTQYRPELTTEELQLIKDQETGVPSSALAKASDDELKKVAYHGTRQFVLVSRDVQGKKQDEYPTDITSGERWWTLTVPCDMTKAAVDEVFGEGTHLCLFSKVVRKEDATNGNEIHLYFQNDTYKNKYTRGKDGKWTKGDAVSDANDVVLYAHTPYMIYPKNTPTKTYNDKVQFVLTNYTLQSGDVLPTIVDANAEANANDAIQYEFTGTYRSTVNAGDDTETKNDLNMAQKKVTIPQYSYVFGKKGSNGKSQFWFYTGTKATWSANKCLVMRYDSKGVEDFKSFFGGNVELSNAKQFSIFGDEEETTGVDRVVYHYGEESSAAIYSINGALVSTSGDRTGLAKGLYIQGGKKFVVK